MSSSPMQFPRVLNIEEVVPYNSKGQLVYLIAEQRIHPTETHPIPPEALRMSVAPVVAAEVMVCVVSRWMLAVEDDENHHGSMGELAPMIHWVLVLE